MRHLRDRAVDRAHVARSSWALRSWSLRSWSLRSWALRSWALRSWAVLLFALLGCGGDAPTYGPCDDARDCGGADRCYRLRFDRSDGSEGDGKLCSRPCANDDDCPGEGVCLALAGDVGETFLCLERCPELGCFEGLACTPVTGADVGPLCLPD